MIDDNKYDATLTAKRVKELRLLKRPRMTQLQAAKAIGVARNTYRDYEQGRRGIKGENLVQISKLLNTTTNYLLGLTDDPRPQTETERLDILKECSISYKGQEIEMTDELREKILDLVKNYADEK